MEVNDHLATHTNYPLKEIRILFFRMVISNIFFLVWGSLFIVKTEKEQKSFHISVVGSLLSTD